VVSIPSRFRGRARRDAAAFYLSQLARGILAGEMGVRVGHETVPVATADFLLLEIEITQKRHANHVLVRVRWPRSRRSTGGSRTSPLPGRVNPVGHAEFTALSSARNPGARDSAPDAHHR
jgi:amphi-Trp domain-containing protein